MGEKRRAHRSLRIRALLLAALMLCAMLPAGRASGMNFTFDLGTVESFDNAETPKPTATPVVTEAPVQQTMEMPEDIPLEVPEDIPLDIPLDTPADADAADAEADDEDFGSDDDAEGFFDGEDAEDDAQDAAEEPEEAAATPKPTYPAEITITAAGDVTLGGASRNKSDKKFAAVARKYGANYFFSNVRSVFEKDDLTIVNLEGPLTTSTDKKKGQYYNYKGNPAYVKILSGSSVEICNVANNHILDFGTKGLKETAQVLRKAGIGVSGFSESYTTTIRGVRITSLGFTQWDHSVAAIRKAVTVARRDCDILIVSMHWGTEKEVKTEKKQRQMGRAAVDAGADLVLGTHSQVYGGIEKYKGKYIVYSLGNFCFGANSNPSDKRCLIFQQTLSYSPVTGVSDAGINIIPCTLSSSAKTNNYRPTMMGAKAGSALLRAVAKASSGMSMANTVWMSDNYMVWSGLTSQQQLDALSAAAKAANNPAPAAASGGAIFGDEADAQSEGDFAEDAGDAEDDVPGWDAGDAGDLDTAWEAAEPDDELAEEDFDVDAEASDEDFEFDLTEME